MSTPWTPEETKKLSGRWRRTHDDKLRLVGACPGKSDPICGHNGAFDYVVVEKINVSGLRIDQQKWPASYPVTCNCGQHADDGCGKTGEVPIPADV